jgi:hypothetical protein
MKLGTVFRPRSASSRWILELFLLFGLLTACTNKYVSVPASTLRLIRQPSVGDTELGLTLFLTEGECRKVAPKDSRSCLPWVDRARGEVHLSFQFILGMDVFPMPITRDDLKVIHMGTFVQADQSRQSYEIIPHDAVSGQQLYVLLIDASNSMAEQKPNETGTRMDRLRAALLQEDVVRSFFPPDGSTGVALFTFTSGKPEPLGGSLRVIEDASTYKALVRDHLRPRGGYTYLYEAVRWGTGELLSQPSAVREFLGGRMNSAVTIITLTDGFNNEAASDTCGTNALRLQSLVKHIQNVRKTEQRLAQRPAVFTVGLGQSIWPSFKLPTDLDRIDEQRLCGSRAGLRIDGYLENYGIDNASMAWIADVGGGKSYVKSDTLGLAEALKSAAAERYRWFEVRYRVDPHYLRRKFETRLRLVDYATAEASVVFVPSAWFDMPVSDLAKDGWGRPAGFLKTTATVMPIFGLLVALTFLPAAFFNARRTLSGRLKKPAPTPRR